MTNLTQSNKGLSYKRRECLHLLGVGVLLSYTGCRYSKNQDISDSSEDMDYTHNSEVDTSEVCHETQLRIQLSMYPELSMIGGSATVSFEDDFVHLLVVCVGQQDWIAVWKICTHGNCDVEWAAELDLVRCPCHNSLFDWDGSVIQGPATQSLSTFNVCLNDSGDALMIHRVASPS